MALGDILRSFAAPAVNPVAVAHDGRTLWIVSETTDIIYQVDPADGTILRSYAHPSVNPTDISWWGRSIWLTDSVTNLITQIDPRTGTIQQSFVSPNGDPRGVSPDDRTLWVTENATRSIDQVDPIRQVIDRSFAPAGAGLVLRGIVWDGHAPWIISATDNTVRQYTPDGDVLLQSFVSPSINPRGLAIDDRSLWLCDVTTDLIYQLSLT